MLINESDQLTANYDETPIRVPLNFQTSTPKVHQLKGVGKLGMF